MAGTLVIDTLNASTGPLSTNNGMSGIAKAWVNWNGNSGGNNTINASFNVSSITYNSTGIWTINFTTALPDTYYVPAGMCTGGSTSDNARTITIYGSIGSGATLKSTTQLQVSQGNTNAASLNNAVEMNVVIHR